MFNVNQLNAMSVEDLLMLNKQVCTIIKNKQHVKNATSAFAFRAGDTVNYDSSKFGRKMTGTVVQVKRTKVVVKTTVGEYLVPAAMLRKGEE